MVYIASITNLVVFPLQVCCDCASKRRSFSLGHFVCRISSLQLLDMYLKLFQKHRFVYLIIIVVCIAVSGYILYNSSGVIKELNVISIQGLHFVVAERQSFVYSDTQLLNTIAGIRDKNCRTSDSSKTVLECQESRKCFEAGSISNNLPKSCAHRYPRSLIIGVAKGGTKELLDFLAMHPDIAILNFPRYELCFFAKKWAYGLDWYKKQMPLSMPNQITMEKCPQYFSDPTSPARIRQMNPDIKLILIIRDPVDRTISHMTFQRNKSAEYIIDVANNKIRDVTGKFHLSFYDEPFERYLKYFNRSQIHIVDSVRFKNEPYSVLHEIESFLALPHLIKEEDLVFNKKKGFYCLRNVEGDFSACYDETRGRDEVKTSLERVRPVLRNLFKPHNERFFNLIGKRFSWQS